jgi:type VI protein secretion system component VasF
MGIRMDWGVTLGIIAAAAGLAAFAGWRGARAPDLRRGPRLTPWRFIMVLAAAVVLLALVHAFNLMGFETGRQPLR